MKIRATHDEIIAHPIRVGLRFTAMFIPVLFLMVWLKGHAIPFSLKSFGGIAGAAVLSTIGFGYGLKLMHGWSDNNAR
jgi:hypothetical protein